MKLKKIILLILFSSSAFVLVLISTQHYGLGVTPDSVQYNEVSKNIRYGYGVVDNQGDLVNHWPPVYPIMLAFTSYLLDLDSLESGRYLNAVLLFVFFVFFNLILNKYNYNLLISLMLNAFLLFSFPISLFIMFLSEGVFMVFLMAAIYTCIIWYEKKNIYLMILVGILSGLMILTRYAGIGFLGGIALFILLLPDEKLKQKFITIVFLISSVILIFSIWILYTHSFNNAAVDREFIFHLISLSKIKDLIYTFSYWAFPFYTKFALIVFLSLLVIYYKYFRLKNIIFSTFLKNKIVLSLLTVSILTYIIFLFASISFFDAHTPLDNRILAPLFPLIVLSFSPFINEFLKNQRLKINLFLVFAVILLGTGYASYKNYNNIYSKGIGYAEKIWIQSETLKELKKLNDCKIYTNGRDVIRFYLTNSSSIINSLPSIFSPNSLKKNETFDLQFIEMKKSIRSNNSILCYFDNIKRYYLANEEFILNEFKNFKILQFKDGFIIKKSIKE